jgi:hypothetical protein
MVAPYNHGHVSNAAKEMRHLFAYLGHRVCVIEGGADDISAVDNTSVFKNVDVLIHVVRPQQAGGLPYGGWPEPCAAAEGAAGIERNAHDANVNVSSRRRIVAAI